METTTDGRSVVLGMGDGSMTTLTIADPAKEGIVDYLRTLPSRNPPGVRKGEAPGIRTGYLQNGVAYPSPYDFSIYTDYLKVRCQQVREFFSLEYFQTAYLSGEHNSNISKNFPCFLILFL